MLSPERWRGLGWASLLPLFWAWPLAWSCPFPCSHLSTSGKEARDGIGRVFSTPGALAAGKGGLGGDWLEELGKQRRDQLSIFVPVVWILSLEQVVVAVKQHSFPICRAFLWNGDVYMNCWLSDFPDAVEDALQKYRQLMLYIFFMRGRHIFCMN